MTDTKASLTAARIRALNAVLEEGSFAAAASSLGTSQPAVSQSVRDLESAFSVKLFQRRGRGLVPTDLCLEIAPLVDQIGSLENRLLQLLRSRDHLKTGVLRIGIGSLMPGMALIRSFQKYYPDVQVQVEHAIYSEIIDAVLERNVDMGILPNVPKDGRFRRKLCLHQEIVALIPLQHRLSGARQVSIRDLVHERLIFLPDGSASQKLIDAAFRRADLQPRASLVLNTHGEVYEAVSNGLGVGFIWCHGTTRKDSARRIPIAEVKSSYEEEVFRLSNNNNPLVDMFFENTEMIEFPLS